jgi:hypothetical protein
MILEGILVKIVGVNQDGVILAVPEDKTILNTIINYQSDRLPIVGNNIKIKRSKYTKTLDIEPYIGKYAKCIIELKNYTVNDKVTKNRIKILILHLLQIDIV